MHECAEVVEECSDPPFVEVIKTFGANPGEEAQEGSEAIHDNVTPNDHGPCGIEPPPVSLKDSFVGSVLVNLFLESKEPVEDGPCAVDEGEEPHEEVGHHVVFLVWQLAVLNGWVAFKTVSGAVTLHE